MDLIFVTESKKDPAYKEIKSLLRETPPRNRRIELIDAGISWHNSQKVHNMLAGIRRISEDSKYVFFLDNDIIVNGAAFDNIVGCIDKNEGTVCSTGYSIEIPNNHSSFASYLVVAFRSIQLLGFLREKTNFIWGGCYMLERKYLYDNEDNYMDMLKDGTYTEDMVLASILTKQKKSISAAQTALFPNVLPKDYKFKSYIKYLRRQYFVLCTYQSKYHLMNNIIQIISMALSFLVFGVPVICWLVQFVTLFIYMFFRLAGYYGDSNEGSGVPYYANVILMSIFLFMVFFLGLNISFCIHSMDKMSSKLSNEQYHQVPNPIKMTLAITLHLMIMPFVAVIAPALRNVIWSEVKYVSKGGRIYKMYRQDENGNYTKTEDKYKTMTEELQEDIKSKISIFDGKTKGPDVTQVGDSSDVLISFD